MLCAIHIGLLKTVYIIILREHCFVLGFVYVILRILCNDIQFISFFYIMGVMCTKHVMYIFMCHMFKWKLCFIAFNVNTACM